MGEDDWRWHMYDTVKGSDWLGDQDAIEYLCRNAADAVYELEHWACRSRARGGTGKIYQRPFGGMTTHYGKGTAQRTCAAADRTGHAMLHTLYGQALKHQARVLHRIFRHRPDRGRGRPLPRRGSRSSRGRQRASLFRRHDHDRDRRLTGAPISPAPAPTPRPATATPWCCAPACPCRTWSSSSSTRPAFTAPGCLITEGVRGEGGYLVNSQGERFMERYAPSARISPRATWFRAR